MTETAALQQHLVEAFNRRDWLTTIAHGEALLARYPDHPGAHYLSGIAQLESGNLAKALAHLHVASERVPDRADVLASYARGLAHAQLHADALRVIATAEQLRPTDANTLVTLALALSRMQLHARAAPLYAEAVRQRTDDPFLRHNLATALLFMGELDAAEREIEACLRLDPAHWSAYDTRAQLRRQDGECHHVDALQTLLAEHANEPEAVVHLCMALSRECDDLGRWSEGFAYLTRAKSIDGDRARYDPASDAAMFQALIEHAPAAAPSRSHSANTIPVFVVGMPRSGTTLVERILDSHPEVHGAGELDQFPHALKRLSGSRSPLPLDSDTICAARTMDWHALGAEYLRSTAHAHGGATYFVDKLPHNFLYLGYIANALPQAPIICLRRHPMDVCLGNFRQRFGERSPLHGYANDLLDIGRYYVLFDQLMRHWQSRYPARVLEVSYERLIDQQETVTREILAFCGLPWNDACLHFERNTSAVGTASAAQVRSPIYRTAVNRWKRYEPQLQELRSLLEAAGITIEPATPQSPGAGLAS